MVAKSNQTDENGMVIVTALNFADVVLSPKTHCFLDVWASWCGPCRQIAPMWVQLAKILKGNKAGIVIAKMDSDANDVNRDYLPEQFIPVLKLFPKGGGQPELLPSRFPRSVPGFLRFLEETIGFSLADHVQSMYGEYATRVGLDRICAGMAEALAHARPNGPAARARFLAQYFGDTAALSGSAARVANCQLPEPLTLPPNSAGEGTAAETAAAVEAECLQLVEAGLLQGILPDDPEKWLATHVFAAEHCGAPAQLGKSPLFGYDRLELEACAAPDRPAEAVQMRWWIVLENAVAELDKEEETIKVFATYLERFFPVNAAPHGQSMLFVAAGHGKLSVVDWLYINGANIHQRSQLGGGDDKTAYLPIEVAAATGQAAVVGYLLECGSTLGAALHCAAAAGEPRVVAMLLKAGALAAVRWGGLTALTAAVIHREDHVAALLVRWHTEHRHPAALNVAVGHEVASRFDLETDVCVFDLAARLGLADTVAAMQARGDGPEPGSSISPLVPQSIRRLVDPAFDAFHAELGKQTAAAAAGGPPPSLASLGASLSGGGADQVDANGLTALMAAAACDDAEAVSTLLRVHGATAALRSPAGMSALTWAKCCGASGQVADLLLGGGDAGAAGAVWADLDQLAVDRLSNIKTSGTAELVALLEKPFGCTGATALSPVHGPAELADGLLAHLLATMSARPTAAAATAAATAAAVAAFENMADPDRPPTMSLAGWLGSELARGLGSAAPVGKCAGGSGGGQREGQLVNRARLFMISAVVGGDRLGAESILAVHLFTLVSAVPAQVNAVLLGGGETADQALVAAWQPYIWQLAQGLAELAAFRGTVYRVVMFSAAKGKGEGEGEGEGGTAETEPFADFLKGYAPGSEVTFGGITTAVSREDAARIDRAHPSTERVLFKIRSKSARSLARYTHAGEAAAFVFLPGARFVVDAVMPYRQYELRHDAVDPDAAELSHFCLNPTVAPQTLAADAVAKSSRVVVMLTEVRQ
jgi:thiol-disulfide isomerase/thioredoxin